MPGKICGKRKIDALKDPHFPSKESRLVSIKWGGRDFAVDPFYTIGKFMDPRSIGTFEQVCKDFRQIATDILWKTFVIEQGCSRSNANPSPKFDYFQERTLKKHLIQSSSIKRKINGTVFHVISNMEKNQKLGLSLEREFAHLPLNQQQKEYFNWVSVCLRRLKDNDKMLPRSFPIDSQGLLLLALTNLRLMLKNNDHAYLIPATASLEEAFSQGAMLAAYIPLYFADEKILELGLKMALKAAEIGDYSPLYVYLELIYGNNQLSLSTFQQQTLAKLPLYPPVLLKLADKMEDLQSKPAYVEKAIESYRKIGFKGIPASLAARFFLNAIETGDDQSADRCLRILSSTEEWMTDKPSDFVQSLVTFLLRTKKYQYTNLLIENYSYTLMKDYNTRPFKLNMELLLCLVKGNQPFYQQKIVKIFESGFFSHVQIFNNTNIQDPGKILSIASQLESTFYNGSITPIDTVQNLVHNTEEGFVEIWLTHHVASRGYIDPLLNCFFENASFSNTSLDLLAILLANDFLSLQLTKAQARIAGGETLILEQASNYGLLNLCIALTKSHLGLNEEADPFFQAALKNFPHSPFVAIQAIYNNIQMGKKQEACLIFEGQSSQQQEQLLAHSISTIINDQPTLIPNPMLLNQPPLLMSDIKQKNLKLNLFALKLDREPYAQVKALFLNHPLTTNSALPIMTLWVSLASHACQGRECHELLEDQVLYASTPEISCDAYFKLLNEHQKEISLDSNHRFNLGQSCLKRGKYRESIYLLEKLNPTDDNLSLRLLSMLAHAHNSIGTDHANKAEACFEKIISIWKKNPTLFTETCHVNLLYEIAYNKFELGKLEEAEQLCDQMKNFPNPSALSLQFMATIKLHVGKPQEAAELTRQARALHFKF